MLSNPRQGIILFSPDFAHVKIFSNHEGCGASQTRSGSGERTRHED